MFTLEEDIMNQSIYTRKYPIKHRSLTKIRLAFFVTFIVNYLVHFYFYGFAESLICQIKFLTYWGYFLSTLLSGYMYFTRADEKCTLRTSYFFHTLIAVEFLITLFFWGVLFDMDTINDYVDLYYVVFLHVVPFAYLVIDFLYNKILLTHNSFNFFTCFVFGYLFTNFTMVTLFDFAIYHVITWNSFLIRLGKLYLLFSCIYDCIFWMGSFFEFAKNQNGKERNQERQVKEKMK